MWAPPYAPPHMGCKSCRTAAEGEAIVGPHAMVADTCMACLMLLAMLGLRPANISPDACCMFENNRFRL